MTAILLGIYSKTGLITYYGPALVASFGELSPYQDLTYEYLKNILIDKKNLPYVLDTRSFWTDKYIPWEEQSRSKQQNQNEIVTVNGGVVKGRLVGGNLNTMQGIWGSEYMPQIKHGDILFIEDSLKDITTIERSFSLLKVNGIFEKIGGLILGKHELFKDLDTGRKPYEVLLEVIGKPNFPILADFGCTVELNATQKLVALCENCIN